MMTFSYVSDSTWQVDKTYVISIEITLLSFGSSISDFHDIVLYLRIEGTFVYLTQQSPGLGKIDFIGGAYSHTFFATSNSTFESSFKVEMDATFRENEAFAFDPATETGWYYVTRYFSSTTGTYTSIVTQTDTTTVTQTDTATDTSAQTSASIVTITKPANYPLGIFMTSIVLFVFIQRIRLKRK